nr:putative reverse transcriptase domain-containing protein [Tanacetum cinerariifolium]
SIKAAPFELLYGRKCRVPICWNEVCERLIEVLELIKITNEKVAVAKEKLKEARSRQKSYADKHRQSILDWQESVMRNKTIPFVKILWKNHPEREATWETEESMRASY